MPGAHLCSQKAKAAVIENWLAAHYDPVEFGHAFGYNADEPNRVARSEEAFRVPHVAFGFNATEMGRVEKAKGYDTPAFMASTYWLSGAGTARSASTTFFLQMCVRS